MREKDLEAVGEDFTIPEVAVLMGVGASTVWGILRSGLVPYRIVEGQCKIPGGSFRQWWEALERDREDCCG